MYGDQFGEFVFGYWGLKRNGKWGTTARPSFWLVETSFTRKGSTFSLRSQETDEAGWILTFLGQFKTWPCVERCFRNTQLGCNGVMQPRLCRSISSKVMVLTAHRFNFWSYRLLIWLWVWRENFWTARRVSVSTVKEFAWADYTLLVWTEQLST